MFAGEKLIELVNKHNNKRHEKNYFSIGIDSNS